MITSFDKEVFDLSGQMNAVALNKVDIINSDDSIKVYIPKIMANIQKGEPKKTKVPINGKTVFKNANNYPANTSRILLEKNYLETNLNASSNIDDLDNTSKTIINELNSTIKKFASVNNLQSINTDKNMSYTINENNELRVEFLNSKLDKLSFTIMDKTKADKELI